MKTKMARFVAAKQAATDMLNTAKQEDRPLTADERSRFDALINEATELKGELDRQAEDADLLAALTDPAAHSAGPRAASRGRSWGTQFAESDQYRQMLASYSGSIPNGTRVQMGAVSVGDVRNTLISDPGFTQANVEVVRTAGFSDDLFGAIDVITDAPQVIKTFTASFTNNAADVAEGATKPESALAWTPATVTLGTVAHHVPVTNQALAHESLVRSEIDINLVNGVRAKLAAKVAAVLAAGTGMTAQAYSTSLTVTIRKAITKAQKAAATLGTGPIGVLVSADDAETIDLEQVANAAYAPGQAPQQVTGLWRSPLVVSPTLAAGFAYVGDLKQIKLYAGGPVSVTTGWIDQQFVENKLTILAEVEAAAAVRLAAAIVKADLTA